MQPFKIPSVMKPPRFKDDNSANLTFETDELSVSDKLKVLEYMGQAGWLLFAPNQIQDSEVPEDQANTDGKSPAQRLRATLFIYWKQVKKGEGDFETFYRATMEKFIDNFKERLT